jgi:hypothetical protein
MERVGKHAIISEKNLWRSTLRDAVNKKTLFFPSGIYQLVLSHFSLLSGSLFYRKNNLSGTMFRIQKRRGKE